MSDEMYYVILHNDHITPMDVVVDILDAVFQVSVPAAGLIMFMAHQHGKSLVLSTTSEEAQRLVDDAHSAAQAAGYPLRFSLEPASEFEHVNDPTLPVVEERAESSGSNYIVPHVAVADQRYLYPTLVGMALMIISLVLPWDEQRPGSALTLRQGACAIGLIAGGFSWIAWHRQSWRTRTELNLLALALMIGLIILLLLVSARFSLAENLIDKVGVYGAFAGLSLLATGIFLVYIGRND